MENNLNNSFLIIGSNLGNKMQHLIAARESIATYIGTIVAQSSVYETEPWGVADQPAFYNQVVLVQTALDAVATLAAIHKIETNLGRIRLERYGARVIDIDILFFNNEVVEMENLSIPHPRIAERNFVLAPLVEIAPARIHPVLNKTVQQIWDECDDKLTVKKV